MWKLLAFVCKIFIKYHLISGSGEVEDKPSEDSTEEKESVEESDSIPEHKDVEEEVEYEDDNIGEKARPRPRGSVGGEWFSTSGPTSVHCGLSYL